MFRTTTAAKSLMLTWRVPMRHLMRVHVCMYACIPTTPSSDSHEALPRVYSAFEPPHVDGVERVPTWPRDTIATLPQNMACTNMVCSYHGRAWGET